MRLKHAERRRLTLELCARLVGEYVERCNVPTFKGVSRIGESAFHAAEVEHAAHPYGQGLADSFAFGRLPIGYAESASALYQARDAEAVPALADELLAAEDVAVRDYSAAAEIPA